MKKLILAFIIGLAPSLSSAQQDAPQFTLAVSESPSWSGTFLTAWDMGLIQGEAGKLGPIEEKWKVDIVIKKADYIACMVLFLDGSADATCLTNVDSLPLSATRKAVALLPTSTSTGADACVVQPTIDNIEGLKGVTIKGLAGSVSEYIFDKCIEALGENPQNFTFESLDPAEVGTQLQSGSIEAGMTWNPVLMETLNAQPKLKRLFDTSLIKDHIVHMVVASQEAMAKPHADAFAYALCDTYFSICKHMLDKETTAAILPKMGQRVANLGLQEMQTIITETQFYPTPASALKLFESKKLPQLMRQEIIPWSTEKGLLDPNNLPTIAFDHSKPANLIFDTTYIQKIAQDGTTQQTEIMANY